MARRLPIVTEADCPDATISVEINLQNRLNAIRVADYGPANPMLPNERYWSDLAREWRVTPAEAKTMRCGNCAAFDISPKMIACINLGLADSMDEFDYAHRFELGYCRMFKFKCAASRTCDAWVVGGPKTS